MSLKNFHNGMGWNGFITLHLWLHESSLYFVQCQCYANFIVQGDPVDVALFAPQPTNIYVLIHNSLIQAELKHLLDE